MPTAKSKKKLFYDNRFVFLAFLCAASIMFVVYMCFELFPFGDSTILRMDLYHQYAPLFSELYDRVTTGGSLIYSWETGLGSSFLGNYFNYLSSPIGFLVMMIAGHKNVPEAIAVMVLLKSSISATTFCYFLRKSYKKSNYVTVGFSVFYAFCGWFIAYYWNVMWIDAMMLLPLIALGIEKIINYGKPLLYISVLALTMFSNYYMSYMMCLFAVIYFLAYYFSHYSFSSALNNKNKSFFGKKLNNRFLRSGTIFAFSSFLAGGLIAFALIPTFFTLQQTSATSGTFPADTSLYFTIFDFISNHLGSLEPTIRSSGDDVLPNVYCGVLTVILLPLYLMTKSIKKKEKIVYLMLLGFFFISFNLNALNYIWHGFHFPNDLPYRQSFMYSFILVVIAFNTFIRLKEIPNRYILFSSLGVIGLTVMAEELKSKNVTSISVVISILFCIIYTLILIALKDKKYQTLSVSVLLLCCMCSESIIGNTWHYSMDQLKTNYTGDYDAFRKVKTFIDKADKDEFYRMELSQLRTRMDNAWYGYNGVSTFSSMAYKNVAGLQKDLGLYGNDINSYTYNSQTAVYNTIFGLKYLVSNNDQNVFQNSDYLKKIAYYDKYTIYQNADTLPLGYTVNNSIYDFSPVSSNPFDIQNDMFEKMTGLSSVLVNFLPESISYSNVKPFTTAPDSQLFNYTKVTNDQAGSVNFHFTVEQSSEIYFYVKTSDEKEGIMTVSCGQNSYSQNLNKNYAYVLSIGKQKKGEDVIVTVPLTNNSGNITIYASYLDNDTFNKGYKILKNSALSYTEVTDTKVSGTVNCQKDGVFMTTIPYDKGWTVTVDGKELDETQVKSVAEALLAFDITEGEHDILLEYCPVGLHAGIYISSFFLLIYASYLIIVFINKKKRKVSKYYGKENDFYDMEVFLVNNPYDIIDDKSNSDYPPVEVEIISPFDVAQSKNVDFTEENDAELGEAEFEKFFNDMKNQSDSVQEQLVQQKEEEDIDE